VTLPRSTSLATLGFRVNLGYHCIPFLLPGGGGTSTCFGQSQFYVPSLSEALATSLQGVAKNFRDIFGELAPGGRGELVMQKAPPKEQAPAAEGEDAEEDAVAAAQRTYDRYSGVRVKVLPPDRQRGKEADSCRLVCQGMRDHSGFVGNKEWLAGRGCENGVGWLPMANFHM